MGLSSLSPRRRAVVVAAAALLGLAAVLAATLAVGRRAAPELAGTTEVPVLLVHGYNGTPRSFDALAARLRSGGRRVVAVVLPERNTGDLRASARALGAAVDRTGAARVDLVGFSAGGVVVRLWLADPTGAARARRVVLLGAPNHGTDLVAAAASLDQGLCTGACAQLAPGSGLLAELNQGDETPPGPEIFSIWTALDRTVTPPATARLEGAANILVQDVCATTRLDHGGLVADPLALGLVAAALEGTLPSDPGPDDCAALRAAGVAER